jgi:Mg2+/Co2+ transporter CorC
MITVEDLLEQIVGDFEDEYDIEIHATAFQELQGKCRRCSAFQSTWI